MSDDFKYDDLTEEQLYRKIMEFESEIKQLKIQLEEERNKRQLENNRIHEDIFDTEWGSIHFKKGNIPTAI